jgi:hypothetical protein
VSITIDAQQMQTVNDNLTAMETALQGKLISLTPEQRQQYGRVKYEMEVWIQTVHRQMKQYPNLVPNFIDMDEFDKDITAHNQLNPLIERVASFLQSLIDTNILLGSDLYAHSISFYRSLKPAEQSNAPGASTVRGILKQQFSSGPGKPPGNGGTSEPKP